MSRRDDLLRRAEHTAAMMRRSGYPDAVVAPEYCIAGEIGPDRFYTETISVYAGEYKPGTISSVIRKALAAMEGRG
jgi:hypothetical protein